MAGDIVVKYVRYCRQISEPLNEPHTTLSFQYFIKKVVNVLFVTATLY